METGRASQAAPAQGAAGNKSFTVFGYKPVMNSESQPLQDGEFTIEFELDEVAERLTLTLNGRIVSQTYYDLCVGFYAKLADPGRYDRLVDCTASKGYVTFDHLDALSRLWRSWLSTAERVVNVAVVSDDPLTHARMGVVDHLSDRQRHRAFFTVAEAEVWLESHRQRPAPLP